MLLKNLLIEDTLSEPRNPALIFLDFLQDVLGNPQQLRIKDSRTIINDEQLSCICKEMAELLVDF